MSQSDQFHQEASPVDPYSDPVSYLASLGLEAELIEEVTRLPEAA